MKTIAAALLFTLPLAAGAGMAGARQPAPATRNLASAFADLYVPDALTRDVARRTFETNIRANFLANPGNAAVEQRYPGALNAGVAAGIVELNAAYDDLLPRLRAKAAGVAAARLTARDLDAINRFYQSPVGQKSLRLGVIDRKAEDAPDPYFQDEYKEVRAFFASAAGRHFIAARPAIDAAMDLEQNSRIDARLPAIQTAVTKAIRGFIDTARAAKGTVR